MLEETVRYLDPRPGKIIVDCTLGFGGHAAALLSFGAKVIGIDQDLEAIDIVRKKLPQMKIFHDNFSNLASLIKEPVDGYLFDLGVSSHQIDEASRGFSLRFDGPLDMRMDRSRGKTASDLVNSLPEEELARVFKEYGEERFAGRIARAIVNREPAAKRRGSEEPKRSALGPRLIRTTFELKEIIEKAIPTWRKRESVSRIFQALRIAVNSELENLREALPAAASKLKGGGRIVVIAYHSLEDRIVKWFFREEQKNGILKIITKRPVVPGAGEIEKNPRARSAKLRCAERI